MTNVAWMEDEVCNLTDKIIWILDHLRVSDKLAGAAAIVCQHGAFQPFGFDVIIMVAHACCTGAFPSAHAPLVDLQPGFPGRAQSLDLFNYLNKL